MRWTRCMRPHSTHCRTGCSRILRGRLSMLWLIMSTMTTCSACCTARCGLGICVRGFHLHWSRESIPGITTAASFRRVQNWLWRFSYSYYLFCEVSVVHFGILSSSRHSRGWDALTATYWSLLEIMVSDLVVDTIDGITVEKLIICFYYWIFVVTRILPSYSLSFKNWVIILRLLLSEEACLHCGLSSLSLLVWLGNERVLNDIVII